MKKYLGYIASPYSHGDVDRNVRAHCELFNKLMDTNILLPIAPLFAHTNTEYGNRKNEQFYLDYDNDLIRALPLKWIIRATARLDDPYTNQLMYLELCSYGADAEVDLAVECHPNIIVVKQSVLDTYDDIIKQLIDAIEEKYFHEVI